MLNFKHLYILMALKGRQTRVCCSQTNMWLYFVAGFFINILVSGYNLYNCDRGTRIIDGNTAKDGQFPFAVKVAGCTGSLISKRLVLTAAHCVTNKHDEIADVKNIKGYVGSVKKGKGKKLLFESITIHPTYKKTWRYDMAILRTTQNVKITDKVRPICLASTHKDNYTNVIAMGWGKTEDGDTNDLMYKSLTIVKAEHLPYCRHPEIVCAYGENNSSTASVSGYNLHKGVTATRIHNGDTAKDGQFPFAVKVTGCTGSLISKRLVLTAAHCMCKEDEHPNVTDIKGYVGSVKKRKGTEVLFERVTCHPRYNKFNRYDIAILRTKKNVKFTKKVKPICLASTAKDNYNNVIAMGWGTTENGPKDKLQYKSLKIVKPLEIENCRHCNMVCAFGEYNSTDSGDSGGPLVTENNAGEYFQIGVLRASNKNGTSFYARVSSSRKFILEQDLDSGVCFV